MLHRYKFSSSGSLYHTSHKVFGIKLNEIENTYLRNNIPAFLLLCEDIIKKNIDEEGLFRLTGSSETIIELQASIELNKDIDFNKYDVHCITGLISAYFRKLPDSLFPSLLYSRWIELGKVASTLYLNDEHLDLWQRHASSPFSPESTTLVKNFVRDLLDALNKVPDCNLEVIRWLVRLLSNVIKHSENNKMGLYNISTILGITLFREPSNSFSIDSFANNDYISSLLSAIIVLRRIIFKAIHTHSHTPTTPSSSPSPSSPSSSPSSPSPSTPSIPIKGATDQRVKSPLSSSLPLFDKSRFRLFGRSSSLILDVDSKGKGKGKGKDKDKDKEKKEETKYLSINPPTKFRSNSVRSVGSFTPLPIFQSKILMKLDDIQAFKE